METPRRLPKIVRSYQRDGDFSFIGAAADVDDPRAVFSDDLLEWAAGAITPLRSKCNVIWSDYVVKMRGLNCCVCVLVPGKQLEMRLRICFEAVRNMWDGQTMASVFELSWHNFRMARGFDMVPDSRVERPLWVQFAILPAMFLTVAPMFAQSNYVVKIRRSQFPESDGVVLEVLASFWWGDVFHELFLFYDLVREGYVEDVVRMIWRASAAFSVPLFSVV